MARAVEAVVGSSPRIRGELIAACRSAVMSGIIPANTGRICGAEKHPRRRWDHPREYGENNLPPPFGDK